MPFAYFRLHLEVWKWESDKITQKVDTIFYNVVIIHNRICI